MPSEWHFWMERNILEREKMFGCDVYNSGSGPDAVWNYPVYKIKNATYRQKPGQDDPKVVEVTCTVSYWKTDSPDSGFEQSLYYKYYVTYGNNGRVIPGTSPSSPDDWLEHPSAPVNYKTPDSAWSPLEQTALPSAWAGQLNYDTILNIITSE